MMKNKLEYIYYRFYRFQVSVGNDSIAVFSSLLMMSFLLLVNVFFIVQLIYAFSGTKIFSGNPVTIGLGLLFSILAINYTLFVHKGKYKKIIKDHKKEPKNLVRKGNVGICLYLFASLVLFAFGFYLMIQRNKGLL